MSSIFCPLELHSFNDRHPRTWICLNGNKLHKIIQNLEQSILKEKSLTRESLSRTVSKKLDCSLGTIKRILQRDTTYYPIPIILELLKFTENRDSFRRKIEKSVTHLKVNSASAKPVKALTLLNKTLAKIIGAFATDGSLSIQTVIESAEKIKLKILRKKFIKKKVNCNKIRYASSRNHHYFSIQNNSNTSEIIEGFNLSSFLIQTHYNIELTEEFKDSVDAFNSWIKKEFDICPTSFKKQDNAWRTIYSNKILARYLVRFFDIHPGLKTFTVGEPLIIKNANLYVRKSFARGAVMFDGCVSMNGKILFSSKSKNLFDAIKEIWTLDEILFGNAKNNRDEWILYTFAGNKKNKLLDYFEKETQKRKMLSWCNGDKKSFPILKNSRTFSENYILAFMREVRKCDMNFLENHFKRSYTTIRNYLNILKAHGKIKISNTPKGISGYISENASVFMSQKIHKIIFKKMKDYFKKEKNAAVFLKVHKGTYSAWKKKINPIPIVTLKAISLIIGIKFEIIQNSVIKINRDIFEIME